VKLANNTNRCFVAASQLLSAVKAYDHLPYDINNNNLKNWFNPHGHTSFRKLQKLGACIIYENAVLCTELDAPTTKLLQKWIEHLRVLHQHPLIIPKESSGDDDTLRPILTEYFQVFPSPTGFSLGIESTRSHKSDQRCCYLSVFHIGSLSLALLTRTIPSLINDYLVAVATNIVREKLTELEALIVRNNNGNLTFPNSYQDDQSYHYAVFDQNTQGLQGNLLSTLDSFDSFVRNSGTAWNELNRSDHISNVILQDHKSGIYCRRAAGKEVYFQPTSPNPHDLFLEYVESTVQQSLKYDHNINSL